MRIECRTKGVAAAVALLSLCVAIRAQAQVPAGSTAASVKDAGAAPSSSAAPTERDAGAVEEPLGFVAFSMHIRALLDGTLDTQVDPATLFDVALDDEAAIRIEASRIRTILAAINEQGIPVIDGGVLPDAGPTGRSDAGEDADELLWRARIDLDRARLAFYELGANARAKILADFNTRLQATSPKQSDAERRAREAEVARQRALEAARTARSEAERLVAGELARLIGIESNLDELKVRFAEARELLAVRRDSVIGWQRRVREAVPADVTTDDMYDALSISLDRARTDLAKAMQALSSSTTEVPPLGPDPLGDIPAEVSSEGAREKRRELEAEVRHAAAEEQRLRTDVASTLHDEVMALNRARLDLLALVTHDKRAAVTGFTPQGWEQARAEFRHLVLVASYHRYVAERWFIAFSQSEGSSGHALWRLLSIFVPWALSLVVFFWWRRRSEDVLVLAERRLAEEDRAERRIQPSWPRRIMTFLRAVHGPLEWLVLLAVWSRLVPVDARELIEIRLLAAVLGWSAAGSLIVRIIDAVAGAPGANLHGAQGVSELRLRSLRLVGRVVVLYILTLELSTQLVGKGTIHDWIISTSWIAAIPISLVLQRWWRDTVFERVERLRKKTTLQQWALENRQGWKSFIASLVAAAGLLLSGADKAIRTTIDRFNLARRAHAYLFKRELDRLAATADEAHALRPAHLAAMAPDLPYDAWLPCPVDGRLDDFARAVEGGHGGVVAIIGARGHGKSSALRRLSERFPHAVFYDALEAGSSLDGLRVRHAASKAAGASTEGEPQRLYLVDNAHVFVKTVMGGLKPFDALLSMARSDSDAAWVFAIDDVIWPFLRRARDGRPLFDDVIVLSSWGDAQIGALLCAACERAGVTAQFDDLLEPLPSTADEIERQDALDAKRAGYFRMVWDHAIGNPGVALEAWRSSLVEGAGGAVRVRPLRTPDPAKLEELPDSNLFVLRTILQLSSASSADIAKATRLTHDQVSNAIRYGEVHGYLERRGNKVTVTWQWFRAVLTLLERRHLLERS